MLKLGSTYLIVKDIEKSINFYEKLLDMKVTAKNFDRWAQFDFDHQCIALFNPMYDQNKISSGEDLHDVYSQTYLDYIKYTPVKYGNNMVLNFYIDDLNQEYERLKSLDIGVMTPIMYMNVAMPYYLFVIEDPDGNTIEITGPYKEE